MVLTHVRHEIYEKCTKNFDAKKRGNVRENVVAVEKK
jgi:hypothetical protein